MTLFPFRRPGSPTTSPVPALVAAIVLAASSTALAQGPGDAAPTARRRTVAQRITEAPVIDGVLDELVWQDAAPIADFVQSEPFEGQPATERTEVRLLYDNSAVYVGVVCYDSDPSGIIVTDSRRDTIGDGDTFQMILDTYHDRQNGFVFGTNVAGVEYDAQVRNEGQSRLSRAPTLSGASGGSGGGVNANWDGSWEVRTQRSDIGWTIEFRIPLRTLRYGPPPQVWGINFTRNIRRKREEVFWSPVARVYNLTRVSAAGDLENLDIAPPRNLQLMPYAISSANRNFSSSTDTDLKRDFGIDAKFGVTSSLNLDLTYNTDFAQVEVDEQQINLTRFNLLFPEKRPFFLENRGLFAVGRSGDLDLFFSRRIGVDEEGNFTPIQGGARLTGRAGPVNIGLLNMQTEGVDQTPANNFTALRVNRELTNRTNFGAIFVGRVATGDLAGSDNWNRTWGLDGQWGVGDTVTFNGFVSRTETPGLSGREHAYGSGVQYQTNARVMLAEYTETGEHFNPEVGFLRREGGYRQIFLRHNENVRTAWLTSKGLREWRPHASYLSVWGFDGFRETSTLHMDNAWAFESGYSVSPAVNIQWEGLREPFEVYPGVIVPPGSYTSVVAAGLSGTDSRLPVSARFNWTVGGFLTGRQEGYAPTISFRLGESLTSSLRWTYNDIHLPEGDFVTNLGSLRVAYTFTTSSNVQALLQYNDRSRRWSTNLRFNWLQSAATGLYVVYNDTEAFNGLGPVNRALIVKYSHMFDIFR